MDEFEHRASIEIIEAYLDGTYTRGLNAEALANRRREPPRSSRT